MNEGRILAIDWGEKRIGIAISDPLRITAQMMPTLTVTRNQLMTALQKIISEKNITDIVVGMPYNLKGEKRAAAKRAEELIRQLKDNFKLSVHTWDERFSSVVAQRTIRELGKSPSRNKAKVDQIAALLILQAFLDRLNYNFKKQESEKKS